MAHLCRRTPWRVWLANAAAAAFKSLHRFESPKPVRTHTHTRTHAHTHTRTHAHTHTPVREWVSPWCLYGAYTAAFIKDRTVTALFLQSTSTRWQCETSPCCRLDLQMMWTSQGLNSFFMQLLHHHSGQTMLMMEYTERNSTCVLVVACPRRY